MAHITDLSETDSTEVMELVNTEILSNTQPRNEYSRNYDALPDSILQLLHDKSKRPLMLALTSCYRNEGVSTVSSNLAQFLARRCKETVLLVDLNLRDPGVHRMFGKPLSPGVIDLVLESPLEISCIQYTSIENLHILTAGENFDEYTGLYDMQSVADLINLMKRDYEFVIFDTPPFCEDSTIIRLAGLVDGIILILEAERVRWEAARQLKERLAQAQGKILGAILNKRKFHVPDWMYHHI